MIYKIFEFNGKNNDNIYRKADALKNKAVYQW